MEVEKQTEDKCFSLLHGAQTRVEDVIVLHILFKLVLFGSIFFLLLLAQLAVGDDSDHVHQVPLERDFLLETVDMLGAGQVEASVDVKH